MNNKLMGNAPLRKAILWCSLIILVTVGLALVGFSIPEGPTVMQATVQPPQITCGGQKASIIGNDAANTLYGTAANDVIHAGGGNDTVWAGGGNDRVCGGAGNDVLYGGLGSDTLYGESGNDILYCGTGIDTGYGGTGTDAQSACETRSSIP